MLVEGISIFGGVFGLIWLATILYLLSLLSRLVKAVEKIEDKLGQ